ncbi:hypothetical protein COV18_06450 [Candidatus Woesearchaeota archaeon CG10_big_fil_rev_8_21_14_0_10_37_12]|nr:MAG: hypothetical protein COV18_06450 [Candidatus Woesearchaeota archaeon CG10_big_fil_rev_8_21_14_0_10_37_12]
MVTTNPVCSKKVVWLSDPHDKLGWPKVRHAIDVAKKHNATLLIGGDLLKQQEFMPVLQARQKGVERLMSWVASEDRSLMALAEEVRQHGGIESLEDKIRSPDIDEETRKHRAEVATMYRLQQEKIILVQEKYAGTVKFNQRWIEEDIKDKKEEIDRTVRFLYAELDHLLGKAGIKAYAVTGNWETNRFRNFPWKNLVITDTQGVFSVDGIDYFSTDNWYEEVNGAEQDAYSYHVRDPAIGGNSVLGREFELILRQFGNEQDVQLAQQGVISERLLQLTNNPVYQRWVADGRKQFGVRLSHKGPGRLAEEGEQHYGEGAGGRFVSTHNGELVWFGGHIHDPYVVGSQDDFMLKKEGDQLAMVPVQRQYVRAGPQMFHLIKLEKFADGKTRIAKNGVQPFVFPERVSYELN